MMPYHIDFDTYEEARLAGKSFGSTKSGIAPFYSDKYAKIGFQVSELFEEEAELKEKIERVFADAKEKHGMRYTQYRGLAQVTNWVKLKFAAMNLHKLANWKWKEHFLSWFFHLFSLFVPKDRLPLAAQPGFSTG